jgi:hypothetical protein
MLVRVRVRAQRRRPAGDAVLDAGGSRLVMLYWTQGAAM